MESQSIVLICILALRILTFLIYLLIPRSFIREAAAQPALSGSTQMAGQ